MSNVRAFNAGQDIELIFIGLILAPILEEWLFRKKFLGFLLKHLSLWVAILLCAIVFALYHGLNTWPIKIHGWTQNIVYIVSGISFSLIYLKSKKLAYPIASHAMINLVGLIPKPAPYFFPFFTEPQSNLYLFGVYIGILASTLFIIAYAFRSGYLSDLEN